MHVHLCAICSFRVEDFVDHFGPIALVQNEDNVEPANAAVQVSVRIAADFHTIIPAGP